MSKEELIKEEKKRKVIKKRGNEKGGAINH